MKLKPYLAILILGAVSCKQHSRLPDDYQILQTEQDSTGMFYTYYGDKDGNNVFGDKKWNIAHKFVDGLAAVQDGQHFGYINNNGDVVIPYTFDCATDFGYFGFDKGLALVKYAYPGHEWWWMHPYFFCGETALIDRKGNEVTPRYEMIWNVGPGGLAVVIESRKNQGLQTDSVQFGEVPDECLFGCIDSLGREVIPCEYDYINPWVEDVTIACKAGRWGAMNGTGELIIPCEYDEIEFDGMCSANNIKYKRTEVYEAIKTLELAPDKIYAFRDGSAYVFDKTGSLEKSYAVRLP